MNGATDCERIGDGWLTQPGNALSSLGLVAAGVWLLVVAVRRRDRWAGLLGVATAGAGLGSFLYHGPMPPGARWMHDASGVVLGVAVVGATVPGWPTGPAVAGLGAGALLMAAWPGIGALLIAVAAAAAVASATGAWRAGRLDGAATATAAGLAGVAAVFLLLGKTGGPLCDPRSPIQAHGAWHLLVAGAIVAVGTGRRNRPPDGARTARRGLSRWCGRRRPSSRAAPAPRRGRGR